MFVRWSNLTVEGEEQRRLPGYRDEAVVRRFDAPEALQTRFYEVRARSILNRVPEQSRMPFRWTINPYRGCSHACSYCFARPTHTYLGFDAGRDFEREIVVKVNAPELARAELARPSWKREHVALGTNTDPYQWVEGRYRLMEGIWEAMRDAANPCSVLTKSPLLLRDLKLMREGLAGDRAAHAEPARATGGGDRAQPRGHTDGSADCATDAGHQRRARAAGAAARGGGRGGRHEHQRNRAAPAWRGASDLHGLARDKAPRPRAAISRALPSGRLRAGARTGASRKPRQPARRARGATLAGGRGPKAAHGP